MKTYIARAAQTIETESDDPADIGAEFIENLTMEPTDIDISRETDTYREVATLTFVLDRQHDPEADPITDEDVKQAYSLLAGRLDDWCEEFRAFEGIPILAIEW